MPPDWRYRFLPGYAPSQRMLDEVGLDFDDDLGGMQKGPTDWRPRLHPLWAVAALSFLPLLIWANPAYGFGFICGAVMGATGMLVWNVRHP